LNFDIFVNPDGTYKIIDGDIIPVSYSQFCFQLIYKSIMNMPADTVSGGSSEDTEMVRILLQSYFHNYFTKGVVIDSNNIEISVEKTAEDDFLIGLSYSTPTPSGTNVNILEGTSFSLSGGALLTIDFEPEWLESLQIEYEKEVIHNITVYENTNNIILPIRPYPSSYVTGTRTTRDLIYLLKTTHNTTIDESEMDFSFYTNIGQSKYPVSRYIDGFIDKENCIVNITIDTDIDSSLYTLSTINGELTFILYTPDIIHITGKAYIVTALQFTDTFSIIDTLSVEPVYKLSPIRGKIVAVFPRTVSPGAYVVKYTGALEEK
jgi:hypothetical protein